MTEELHVRLLALTLTMLGVAGALTVPLAQTNARERVGPATVAFACVAVAGCIAGLSWRRPLYRWLRASRLRQFAPALIASTMVFADGPYSPSWWMAQALLFIVAAVAGAGETVAAGALTSGVYLAAIVVRGASLLPAGEGEYLAVALSLGVNPLVARAMAETFARFTLHLHQLERDAIARTLAPIEVELAAPSIGHDPRAVRPERGRQRPGGRVGRSVRTGASRLTARQLEVALLARDGLRQAEIAAALAISPRQVERHLEQARARVGAATTAHLIAMLVDGRLAPAMTSPEIDASIA